MHVGNGELICNSILCGDSDAHYGRNIEGRYAVTSELSGELSRWWFCLEETGENGFQALQTEVNIAEL